MSRLMVMILAVMLPALVAASPAVAAPPPNDAFASAAATTPASGVPAAAAARTDDATKEAGEPELVAGEPGGASVWWRWQATANERVIVSARGSGFEPLLGVYTGASLESLVSVGEAAAESSTRPAEVSFQATAGQTYRILVDGRGGETGSARVDIEHFPRNDHFASAAATSPVSGAPATASGSNQYATFESGEPTLDTDGGATGATIWYRWHAVESGPMKLTTGGSEVAPMVGVYTGGRVNALTLVGRTGDYGHELVFQAVAGTTYMIQLDTPAGTSGELRLLIERFLPAVSIGDATVAEGNAGQTTLSFPVSLEMADTRTGTVRYDAIDGGAVAPDDYAAVSGTLTFAPGQTEIPVAVQVNGDVVSEDDETLSVKLSEPGNARVGDGRAIGIIVNDDVAAPSNDRLQNAQPTTPADGLPATATGNNRNATLEPGEPRLAGDEGGASVWYVWRAVEAGAVRVSTAGSDFDTLLGVYTGTSVGSLTAIAADDDAGSGVTSELTFAANAGQAYAIRVDGARAQAGTISLALTSAPDSAAAVETGSSPSLPSFAAGRAATTNRPGSRVELPPVACPDGTSACDGRARLRLATARSSHCGSRVVHLGGRAFALAPGEIRGLAFRVPPDHRRFVRRCRLRAVAELVAGGSRAVRSFAVTGRTPGPR